MRALNILMHQNHHRSIWCMNWWGGGGILQRIFYTYYILKKKVIEIKIEGIGLSQFELFSNYKAGKQSIKDTYNKEINHLTIIRSIFVKFILIIFLFTWNNKAVSIKFFLDQKKISQNKF